MPNSVTDIFKGNHPGTHTHIATPTIAKKRKTIKAFRINLF
jgi:hypothetical protein